MRYPLANSAWDEAEIAAIHSVIQSGMYSMNGRVAEFEQAFAAYTGSRHCVMVNSGSSANLLMVAALRYRNWTPQSAPAAALASRPARLVPSPSMRQCADAACRNML